ncbi:hypothetical protein MY1884_008728 [Beauveria asiatica]
MSRFDISPLCFDYMGDFGDDDHRPAKRLRFDEAAAGQGAPPPDVHEDEIWGMSQTSNPEWHFSNSILAPDPFIRSMPGSLNGIVPEQIFTMPMSSPAASGFPIDTMVPPWGTRFKSAAPYVNMNWENPRYVPSSFGLDAKMDSMDRKLFKFYVQNWCPGRSVLKKTNLWLTDFARLHNQEGVRAAIHSLAGVYIHDYLPNDSVRRRVNERFRIAEDRLSHLLQSPHRLSDDESSELVTLVSLLSMQDIVLTERRLKKPYHPRWLTGFKQAENILQLTDPGNRFYKKSNVQVDTLRLSQSVIVGRAVILAQPMMPHPPIATFDPAAETARFGFLLYGSEQEIYEIHGGCGFSKRLLHIFSQVTYCSARMLQEPETPIVPMTAKMLYDQLLTLKQWSGEWDSWEAAQERTQQPIHWIRQKGETLPRNHPEVVVNLADLAKTISIMPTSGLVFTAQAPLLPVFVLGLLATVEDHVQVAHDWFQQVIYTPVRSSVPPLYDALVRIQSWIDIEIPVPASCMELPRTIAERQPWWERMVSKVQEKEVEVLCLT